MYDSGKSKDSKRIDIRFFWRQEHLELEGDNGFAPNEIFYTDTCSTDESIDTLERCAAACPLTAHANHARVHTGWLRSLAFASATR